MAKTSNQQSKEKPKAKSVKEPKLLSFLISQINNGYIPTREELEDVFEELPQRYYRDVCIALLKTIKVGVVKPPQATVSAEEGDTGLTKMAVPPRPVKKVPTRPPVDPNRPMKPGDLGKGANIFASNNK